MGKNNKIWEQINKNSDDIKNLYKEKNKKEKVWWKAIPIIISLASVGFTIFMWFQNLKREQQLQNQSSYYENLAVKVEFSETYETGTLNIGNSQESIDIEYKPGIAVPLRGSIKDGRIIYYINDKIIVSPTALMSRDSETINKIHNTYSADTIYLKALFTLDALGHSYNNYYSTAYLLLEDFNGSKTIHMISYCFDKTTNKSKGQVVLDEYSILYDEQEVYSFSIEDDGLKGNDKILFEKYLKEEIKNYKKVKNKLVEAGLF